MPAENAQAAEGPRERGWRRFLPGLLLFLLVPVSPYVPMLVPIQETILLLGCGMAASTLVAWRFGGRAGLAIVWTGLAAWMLSNAIGGEALYSAVARGWTLLLVASFAAVSMYAPSQRFLPRALTTLALAFAMAGAVALGRPGGLRQFDRVMQRDIDRRAQEGLAYWNQVTGTADWKKMEESSQSAIDLTAQIRALHVELPNFSRQVIPALIALESLAALALMWGLFHRVSRTRLGPPLAPLRELRFSDQLVWGLVLGATFVVLPSLSELNGAGYNLLLFFGALYALRGFGVLLWFLKLQRVALVFFVMIALLVWPITGIFSLGIGLGDTWLDWRGRAARQTT